MKMCHCGRGFIIHNRACCIHCDRENWAAYEAKEFNASQFSQRLERIEPPQHRYTQAAAGRIPAQRETLGL